MEPWNIWGPCTVKPGTQQIIRVTPPNVTEVIGTVLFNNLSPVPMALTVWIVPVGMQPDDGMIVLGTPLQGLELSVGNGEPYIAHAMSGLVLKAGHSVIVLATQPMNSVASGWICRSNSEMPVIQGPPVTRPLRPGSMTIVTNVAGLSGALRRDP